MDSGRANQTKSSQHNQSLSNTFAEQHTHPKSPGLPAGAFWVFFCKWTGDRRAVRESPLWGAVRGPMVSGPTGGSEYAGGQRPPLRRRVKVRSVRNALRGRAFLAPLISGLSAAAKRRLASETRLRAQPCPSSPRATSSRQSPLRSPQPKGRVSLHFLASPPPRKPQAVFWGPHMLGLRGGPIGTGERPDGIGPYECDGVRGASRMPRPTKDVGRGRPVAAPTGLRFTTAVLREPERL